MPEGPETHRMADRIHKSLKGKKILKFKFQHDALSELNNLKSISISFSSDFNNGFVSDSVSDPDSWIRWKIRKHINNMNEMMTNISPTNKAEINPQQV